MKIISGSLKGRIIKGYDIEGTRPTMDRVKESLFGMIQTYISDKVVLDLFAGTGNLGFEAISNGAKMCIFNDKNKKCTSLIKENINIFDIESKAVVLNLDYNKALEYIKENNIKLSESEGIYQKLYEQAKTVIFVSDDEKLLGIIAISDTVKQTSIEAINGFKDMKIETYMLTGDNKTSAQAIGKMVGIDNIISEVLPQEKESKVRSLQEQGKIVAMIGDRNK